MSIAPELDYAKSPLSHGTYEYSKITQQTGLETVTITTTYNGDSIFELPQKVMNLSKTIIDFVGFPATGTNFNLMFADTVPMIRQIQLYTRTGLMLADINDLNVYLNVVLRRELPYEYMITLDNPSSIGAGATTFNAYRGVHEGIFASNLVTGSAIALDANSTIDKANIRPIGLRSGAGTADNEYYGSSTNYLEARYLIPGETGSTTPSIHYQFRLGHILNSIFSLDKDLYFNDIMMLRIVWAPSTRICYMVTALNNPKTGAAPTGGDYTINKLSLYLAVEVNAVIENEIKNKIMSGGLSVLCPYIHLNKFLINSTSQIFSQKYYRSHGERLLKLIWAPFNATETGRTAYDHTNLGGPIGAPSSGTKISTYYDAINNKRLVQFDYDCVRGTDYIQNKQKLKGGSMFSANEYYYNWAHFVHFINNQDIAHRLDMNEDTLIDGLDLTNEVKYDVFATTGDDGLGAGNVVQNINNYLFAITQKTLTITPNGIVLN